MTVQHRKGLFIAPFKMHKIIFFPENLKNNLGFASKFRYCRFTLNTGILYLALCLGILGQVWRLIVSIPDLCPLSYFDIVIMHMVCVDSTDF